MWWAGYGVMKRDIHLNVGYGGMVLNLVTYTDNICMYGPKIIKKP